MEYCTEPDKVLTVEVIHKFGSYDFVERLSTFGGYFVILLVCLCIVWGFVPLQGVSLLDRA